MHSLRDHGLSGGWLLLLIVGIVCLVLWWMLTIRGRSATFICSVYLTCKPSTLDIPINLTISIYLGSFKMTISLQLKYRIVSRHPIYARTRDVVECCRRPRADLDARAAKSSHNSVWIDTRKLKRMARSGRVPMVLCTRPKIWKRETLSH